MTDLSYDPGYNIAPTESVLTVRNAEGRKADVYEMGADTRSGLRTREIGAQDDQRPGRDRRREACLPQRPEEGDAVSFSPTAITNGRRPQRARGHFA